MSAIRSIRSKYAAVHQQLGHVTAMEGTEVRVTTSDGERVCSRARGCVIEPAVGDLVLLAVAEPRSYILDVLEREAKGPTEFAVEGDLAIRARGGSVSITATEGVALAAPATTLTSSVLKVAASEAEVVVGSASFLGTVLRASADRMHVAAKSLDSAVERVRQTMARCYRRVTEFEQLRAERLDYATDKNMSLRAANTLLISKELTKVDAEQVHIG